MDEDKLEKLIERKIEEKVEDKLDEKLDEKVEEAVETENEGGKKEEKEDQQDGSGISRRGFLKKLGIGAAGLGALSLTPTSALQLKSDHPMEYFGAGSSNPEFKVTTDGNVEVKKGDLRLSGASLLDFRQNNIGFRQGNNFVSVYNSSSVTDMIQFYENGRMDLGENKITGLATEASALEWSLDGNTAGERWTSLGFNQANGPKIGWINHASADKAFRVRDLTNNNNLLDVNDGGDVKIPSGELSVPNNGANFGDEVLVEASSSGPASVSVNTTGNGNPGFYLDEGGTLSGLWDWSTSNNEIRFQERRSTDGNGNRQIRLETNGSIKLMGGPISVEDGPLKMNGNGIEGLNAIRGDNSTLAIRPTMSSSNNPQDISFQTGNGSGSWRQLMYLNGDGDIEIPNGDLIFDSGDHRITNHDGHGNFNFKSGVDNNNTIVSGQGGSHLRLQDGGGIHLEVDNSTSNGGNFSNEVYLDITDKVYFGASADFNNNSIDNVEDLDVNTINGQDASDLGGGGGIRGTIEGTKTKTTTTTTLNISRPALGSGSGYIIANGYTDTNITGEGLYKATAGGNVKSLTIKKNGTTLTSTTNGTLLYSTPNWTSADTFTVKVIGSGTTDTTRTIYDATITTTGSVGIKFDKSL